MDNLKTSLPELSELIDERLALLRSLADSLETSSLALVQNDSEAIARGAAYPAVPLKPNPFKADNPLGCNPSGRRSQPGSVISRECTGRCCGTWSAVSRS